MRNPGVPVAGLFAVLFLVGGEDPEAYPRYKNNNQDAGSNCSGCHGEFTGPTSPLGTTFPRDSKHEMHR